MKHRYKITVEGTGIREYYEYDQCLDEAEVREDWLSDVSDRWGEGVAQGFSENVEVERITDDEPPALP